MRLRKTTSHNFTDLTGHRFCRLIVVSRHNSPSDRSKPTWLCECDCGKTKVISGVSLRRGNSKSCGCLCIDRSRVVNRVHGMKNTRTYRIWSGMKNRCVCSTSKDFKRYGARGITLCPEWMMFEAFHVDMGNPPDGMTLGRIDNNKGYCKENCRWESPKQQARNRRGNVIACVDGTEKTCAEWDEDFGFYPGTVAKRFKKGTRGQALLAPINPALARCQKTPIAATDLDCD